MKLHSFFSVTVFCLRDFDMEMLKVHDCVRSFHMDVLRIRGSLCNRCLY